MKHWRQQTGAAVALTLPSLVVVPATVLDSFCSFLPFLQLDRCFVHNHLLIGTLHKLQLRLHNPSIARISVFDLMMALKEKSSKWFLFILR